jgi:hypothetical protein
LEAEGDKPPMDPPITWVFTGIVEEKRGKKRETSY